jgi:hypothetical protein
MLCLLQCLDGESSSGESPVPQISSIGQFILSRLFSSLTSGVLRSGFSWASSVVLMFEDEKSNARCICRIFYEHPRNL